MLSTMCFHRYEKEAIVDYHVTRIGTQMIQSFMGNVVFHFTYCNIDEGFFVVAFVIFGKMSIGFI